MIVHLNAKHVLSTFCLVSDCTDESNCRNSHGEVHSAPVQRRRVCDAVKASPAAAAMVTAATRLGGLRFQAERYARTAESVRAELTVRQGEFFILAGVT